MTSSTRSNDEPAMTTDEKWVEYGTRGGGTGIGGGRPAGYSALGAPGDSGYSGGHTTSSSSSKHFSEKTIGFTDSGSGAYGGGTRPYGGVDPGLKHDFNSGRTQQTQMEFMTPVNTTTVLSKSLHSKFT
jgi:hypothetical protein